MGNNPVDKKV